MIYIILTTFIILVLCSIRQVDQYERGIKFQFGKFKTVVDPGWRIVWPVIQSMRKIDMRTKVIDVPEQDVITKDNVSLRVSAVLYFRVCDAAKAVLDVEDYRYATSQLALTTMKTAVGEVTLDELLSQRDTISTKICKIVDEASDPWGVKVENVELKEIILPEDMKRVIAKEAEAEREKKAVITKAAGEVVASENLSKAAAIMAKTPGAMHLRTLATLSDISPDPGNTIIFAVPVEVLDAFKKDPTEETFKLIDKYINKK